MLCVILSFFIFSVPGQQAPDSLLIQESKKQVRQYAKAAHLNQDVALNVWALAEVSKDKHGLLSYLNSYSLRMGYTHHGLQVFKDTTLSYAGQLRALSFATKSPVLLVAYLLAEQDTSLTSAAAKQFVNRIGYPESGEVDYRRLIDAILHQKPITPDVLPNDQFYPVHFFLFWNSAITRNNLFSKAYLKTVGQKWQFTTGLSLPQSLGIASLFRTYYLLYDYAKTENLYRPLADNKLFPISLLRLTLFRMLDYSMYRLGYYSRSLDIIREHSLPLAQYLNQRQTEFKLRIAKGSYLYYIGEIEQSKEIYLQVQQESQLQDIRISHARVFNNLAIDYWKSGEFDWYLELQFQALQEAKKENNYSLHFDILKNLFTHYRINKDFSSAKQYLEKAKQLAAKNNNTEDMARTSYLEGQLYRDSKSDYGQAIASYDKALSLISPENHYTSYQDILTAKSRIFELQGKYEQAQNIYNLMIDNALQRKDQRNAQYASFNKANLYLKISQQDSAQIILDTLATQNLDALDFYQLVKARTVQARFQKQTGQLQNGINILKPVINQIVKRSRGSGDIETGFWQVEPEYLDAFEAYANLLIDAGQTENAVEALDQLKTINDAALYQNPLVRSKVLNEKELSQYKRLTDELDVLRKKLLTSGEAEQSELQQKIDERSAQKNALDRKITANADQKPVSVDYIQRGMDAHERVLHITELNNTYYLATISRTDVQFQKIPISDEMRARFRTTIAQIASGSTNLKNLYAVTELLDIANLPGHIKKLTIIPDSYLYQLPLDILPLHAPAQAYSYGDAEYLIERFRTNYMTSLNDFKNPVSDSNPTYDYTGFGVSRFADDRTALVPLPQATTEIKNISKKLTALNKKATYLNEDATEQAFREAAPHARILHLATHSEVSGRDPMFSSIYLSRSPNDNEKQFPGRIFAYEFFELNLQNDLIMLNSCESGSGSYLQGTGVVGISRALRYAGAKSLVLNLWSVNDALASEFSSKFYEGINKGETKSEALRNAKLYFLKTKNANPHYWGSYMLLGNKNAIVHPNRFANNIVAASFMIFFFSLTLASSFVEIKRRRRQAVNGS